MGIPIYEVFRFAFPNADSSDLNGAVVRGENLEDAAQKMIDYIGCNMDSDQQARFFPDLVELKNSMRETTEYPEFWFYHLRVEDKDDVILCAFNCC
jgi:hypothetical protein